MFFNVFLFTLSSNSMYIIYHIPRHLCISYIHYIYISTIHLEFSIHVVLVEYPMLSSVVQSPQMSREWLVYAQDTVKLLCRCCNMVPCLPSLRKIGINFISYADIFTHCAWDWCFYVNTVLILEVLVLYALIDGAIHQIWFFGQFSLIAQVSSHPKMTDSW